LIGCYPPSFDFPSMYSLPTPFRTPVDFDPLVYTGRDPLKNMEVIIQVGDCKLHHAVVLGTRRKEDKDIVDVRTTTKVENVVLSLDLGDVCHLQSVFFIVRYQAMLDELQIYYSTGLPLLKARWLPQCHLTPRLVLPPHARPQTPRPEGPLAIEQSIAELEAAPLTPAWDPLSQAHETFTSQTPQRGKISN